MTNRNILAVALTLVILAGIALPALAQLTSDQEKALRALARDEEMSWPGISDEQAAALYNKEEEFLRLYRKYHLPHGLNADIWWDDYSRNEIVRLEGIGDSACWAGHYMAALAIRYSITKEPELIEEIGKTLDKIDLLTTVTGREGYIARYVGPEDHEGYRAYYSQYGRGEDPERPGLGHWAYRGVAPHEDLIWLGYSSRDTYLGVNFGLATVWVYAPAPEIRAKVKTIAERVGDRLIEDKWYIIDGKGHTTRPTGSFRAQWLATMLATSPEKYAPLQKEYDLMARGLSKKHSVYPKTYGEYFANNLGTIALFAVCILEKDPERKAALNDTFRARYEEMKDHLNAQFCGLYLLATGDKNEAAIATLQGMLVDYPAPPKWVRKVDYRDRDDIEKENDKYAKYAFLAHEMVPGDFIWQRQPGKLYTWDRDVPIELPGLDVILPYWAGRAAGAIPPPETKDAQ